MWARRYPPELTCGHCTVISMTQPEVPDIGARQWPSIRTGCCCSTGYVSARTSLLAGGTCRTGALLTSVRRMISICFRYLATTQGCFMPSNGRCAETTLQCCCCKSMETELPIVHATAQKHVRWRSVSLLGMLLRQRGVGTQCRQVPFLHLIPMARWLPHVISIRSYLARPREPCSMPFQHRQGAFSIEAHVRCSACPPSRSMALGCSICCCWSRAAGPPPAPQECHPPPELPSLRRQQASPASPKCSPG